MVPSKHTDKPAVCKVLQLQTHDSLLASPIQKQMQCQVENKVLWGDLLFRDIEKFFAQPTCQQQSASSSLEQYVGCSQPQ